MNTVNIISNNTLGFARKSKKTDTCKNQSNGMTLLPAIVLSTALLSASATGNNTHKSDSYYLDRDYTEYADYIKKISAKAQMENFVNLEDGTMYVMPYLPQIKIAKAMPQTNLVADDL